MLGRVDRAGGSPVERVGVSVVGIKARASGKTSNQCDFAAQGLERAGVLGLLPRRGTSRTVLGAARVGGGHAQRALLDELVAVDVEERAAQRQEVADALLVDQLVVVGALRPEPAIVQD